MYTMIPAYRHDRNRKETVQALGEQDNTRLFGIQDFKIMCDVH